jgi:multidrug efflux pump
LKSDLQISKPEIIIDLDKEKMQREGISLGQVAVELRTALFGKEVSKFRDVERRCSHSTCVCARKTAQALKN